MTAIGTVQILILLVILVAAAPFAGEYMARVFQGQRVFLSPVLLPVERGWYRLIGIREDDEQHWTVYMLAVLLFSVVGILISYLMLRLQNHLPLNPDHQAPLGSYLSFNSSVSFASNTNWQNYAGETTLSYLSQMLVLARTNFTSGATGIAVAVAFIRGFSRQSARNLGSFWVDLTRTILYVFLPLCIVMAVVYVAQGVPQTLGGAVTAHTLDGATQVISRGPMASQEAIKLLGSNGGGFFNTSSAHPFENPTPFTNLMEMATGALVGFGLVWTFGRMVGNVKQGLAIISVMTLVFVGGIFIAASAENTGNPLFTKVGVDQSANGSSPGGNMEGKEVRFGPIGSATFNAVMTGTSTGAANSALDSYTPLGGMVPLVLIKLGDITPGGAGNGLYGILIFAVVTCFTGGLMVGRTPEYLGKKIQGFEVKMAALGAIILPVFVFSFAGLSAVIPAGTSAILNNGPHGLSEILYAFASTVANNGSAFAGLSANTNYYNVMFVGAMWIGRFLFMVPVLALAGSLAAKRRLPMTAGTMATDNALFAAVLFSVIVIVGALTMFPALCLGPIAEHFRMGAGQLSF